MVSNRRSFNNAGFLLALIVALTVTPLAAGVAAAATQQQPRLKITVSKNAYWYKPGGKVQLRVVVNNQSHETVEGVTVRARVRSRNTARADLDSSLDGKPAGSTMLTETLQRALNLEPGRNSFKYELALPGSMANGVYPMSVEAVPPSSNVSSGASQLVIMSSESRQSLTPLLVSLVYDMSEPFHKNPAGDFRSEELAAECAPGGKTPGWYATFTSATEKYVNVRPSLALSPLLIAEMTDFSTGCAVENPVKGTKKVAKESKGACNVDGVAKAFKRLAQDPRFQFLLTPYASPDIEKFASLGWQKDVKAQITLGHTALEKYLGAPVGREYFYPPALKMDSTALKSLGAQAGHFMLLDPILLERTAQGRSLAAGKTLCSPVAVKTGKNTQALALFADERLQGLAKQLQGNTDPHYVAQAIVSELTNLYLESPKDVRATVFAWPSRWRPPAPVFDEVLKALSETPWLHSATMSESFSAVPAIETAPVEIPAVQQPTGSYFAGVGVAREKYYGFSKMVFKNNSLLAQMLQNLYTSQSDVWRQWNLPGVGLSYADWVTSTVDGELKKITIPNEGSITLMGDKGNVPFSVINNTGYRVKVKLFFSSDGLAFPNGASQRVVLEPKERVFEIPVRVLKKGRVRFTARLEAGGMAVGNLNVYVKTGRFSSFALILVGVLLGVIVVTWTARVAVRRRAGKHKKKPGRKREEESEEE